MVREGIGKKEEEPMFKNIGLKKTRSIPSHYYLGNTYFFKWALNLKMKYLIILFYYSSQLLTSL